MTNQMNSVPAAEPLFDLSMIKMGCRGNESIFREMIVTFIESTTEALEEIKKSYELLDLSSIRHIAHRIKPTLAIYAVANAEQHIKAIEQLAASGADTAELGLRITRLDYAVSNAVNQMKRQYSFI